MKRLKREIKDRAFSQGLRAGTTGRSMEDCPYGDGAATRDTWVGGWEQGRTHFRAGYMGGMCK